MASVSTHTSRRPSPGVNPSRNPPSASPDVPPATSEQSQNSDRKPNYCDPSSFPPLQAQISNLVPLQVRTSKIVHEHVKEEPASYQSSSTYTQSPNPSTQDSIQISASSILHISFNEDHACFAAGTNQGLGLYNCEPFGKRNFVPLREFGTISIAEMFGCNVCALVGGGSNPMFPPTKVKIWDAFQKRLIGTVPCKSEVKAVRLLRDYLIIVLKQKIQIYEFYSWRILRDFDTIENPNGLCAVSQCSGFLKLVFPGFLKGQIRVQDYGTKSNTPTYVPAHSSEIACLALSQDGKLVATASTKGTLVRIFNTSDQSLLQEVRRGANKADIYSLSFSSTSQWLAVLSGKGTVHVFAVKFNSGMLEMLENENLHSVSDLNIFCPSVPLVLFFHERSAPEILRF